MLSIIVACDLNGGIGKDNKLLFRIPEDLKRFKELTIEKTVIMGRKTFESLPNGALPNRENIIVTKNAKDLYVKHEKDFMNNDKLFYCNDLDKLIQLYKSHIDEFFVIGGAEIYKQLLPHCNKIYLTKVYCEKEADAFFFYNKDEWKIKNIKKMDGYDYINLVRK